MTRYCIFLYWLSVDLYFGIWRPELVTSHAAKILLIASVVGLWFYYILFVSKFKKREIKNKPSDKELELRFNQLHRAGICSYCYGAGRSDDPPWGIVKCSECNGTGKEI